MIGLLCFVLTVLAWPFKSKLRLEAENLVVCTENLIRVDDVMESPKLADARYQRILANAILCSMRRSP